jgi:hypothetical protein
VVVAAENFDGWAGLVHAVFAPFDLKVAAAKVDRDPLVGSLRQSARDADGAGSGAASERFSAAAFPDSHFDFRPRDHASKLDVDLPWKRRVNFQFRSDPVIDLGNNPTRPAFNFNPSSYWVQGLNVGFEFKF